ncbi:hypothetical protein AAFF_G00282710 [Aldrovandia affinis]|uniref:Uncharacterized protein n=1 Tax=Aldrovandia affinis TaxID=143900 RepID=A0AAD7X2J0_9TELE|nr:hypothetical protein AAFF_G00282710 [Aldrovandia affinis]
MSGEAAMRQMKYRRWDRLCQPLVNHRRRELQTPPPKSKLEKFPKMRPPDRAVDHPRGSLHSARLGVRQSRSGVSYSSPGSRGHREDITTDLIKQL